MKEKIDTVLFNKGQAASYLGIDRTYLNFLIEQGEVTEIQLPMLSQRKGRRIPKKSCDSFIERNIYRRIKDPEESFPGVLSLDAKV